ncbi:hypothetical protein Pth03_80960 [Planotetraspora thailandica]|uniref:Uncharacterized protein n=1 Tax=Planotetraspora thailandica TaxID=487172 RepID=A0A8J3Y2K2_9ACTN|nr:hypothetical protein Pth03_80960 [Planotetraspora thailandica]
MLEHEHGIGCRPEVSGESGQLAERPGPQRALQPGVKFLGIESTVTGGNPQRVHDTVPIPVRCPQIGQIIRHGRHASKVTDVSKPRRTSPNGDGNSSLKDMNEAFYVKVTDTTAAKAIAQALRDLPGIIKVRPLLSP